MTSDPIGFAGDGALDVARRPQVEDDDRQPVVHAQRNRGRVHHLQALFEHLQVRDAIEADRVGLEHRVGVVDAVDLRGLEDDLGLDLHRAQRRRRIGAEEGIAGAGAEDDDAALFEVADGAAADERLGDRAHLDGGDHAGDDALLLERVLQRQRVDDRRQHAHVVGGRPVHPARAGGDAAEDIAAADDDGGLDAHRLDFGDVERDLRGHGGIDAVVGLAHQGFAGEFEKDAFVGGSGRRGHEAEIIAWGWGLGARARAQVGQGQSPKP